VNVSNELEFILVSHMVLVSENLTVEYIQNFWF